MTTVNRLLQHKGYEVWSIAPDATVYEALELMAKEGLANIFARHARVGQKARDEVKSLGLPLFAAENHASDTVTAVKAPDGLDVKKLLTILREEHNVILAGGQGELAGNIFRIGHLGWVTESDIEAVIERLKVALPKAGFVRSDYPGC